MENTKTQELAALLEKTGHAHHQAFIKTDGVDPEWALWYAATLEKPLSSLLNKPFTQSKIIYELVRLEETADVSNALWPQVYAKDLVEKYG
ncbi:hypothetical protein [Spongiimicrobium sp. 2-473A-2-J]|uniref:hypothetical protein n=1 Tax=Eudoraea algarum TaxID=3417568 RepID=UPI003D35BBC9